MTRDPQPIPATAPLSYARQLPPDVRRSRLAWIALLVSIVSSPFLLMAMLAWLSGQHRGRGHGLMMLRFSGAWFVFMAVGLILSLAALLHIQSSRGRLLGWRMALAALITSLVWWGITALLILF